jgi:hypothetical protein
LAGFEGQTEHCCEKITQKEQIQNDFADLSEL